MHQVPVFVGIVGKRALHDNPLENQRLTTVLQQRIDVVLDRIECELPGIAKVLLTGGAAGADLIVARRVLGLDGGRSRPEWLVAVVPFPLELFIEDFSGRVDPYTVAAIRLLSLTGARLRETRQTPLECSLGATVGVRSAQQF